LRACCPGQVSYGHCRLRLCGALGPNGSPFGGPLQPYATLPSNFASEMRVHGCRTTQ